MSRCSKGWTILPASSVTKVRRSHVAGSWPRILSVPLWWSLSGLPVTSLRLPLVVAPDHISIAGLCIAPGVRLSLRLAVCGALPPASAADHCPWILRLMEVHNVREVVVEKGLNESKKSPNMSVDFKIRRGRKTSSFLNQSIFNKLFTK